MNTDGKAKKSGHPRVGKKTAMIAGAIRSRIVSGELEPGDELPTRMKLLNEFSVSNETMQRAANLLLEDGFLVASRGVGTRVANHPPHLNTIAVVIPEKISGFESLLWQTARQTAAALQLRPGQKLRLYSGGLDAINEEDLRLVKDVENHRVAGILFITNQARFHGTPVLMEPHLPRVVWSSGTDNDIPRRVQATLWFDYPSLAQLAVQRFAAHGRRRIAVVAAGASFSPFEPELSQALDSIGATSPARWRHIVHAPISATAHNIMSLLMHPGQSERPDAILILDDNLEQDICLGLLAANVRVPEDVMVVSHANFPTCSPPAPVPVTRIGFNIEELFRLSVYCLFQLRRGAAVPDFQRIKAIPDPTTAREEA